LYNFVLKAEFQQLLQKKVIEYIFENSEFQKIFEYAFEYSALVIVYRLYIPIIQKGIRKFPKYSNISQKGIRIFRIYSNILKKLFEYSKSRRKMDEEQKHDS
jgi:hypothetical protein